MNPEFIHYSLNSIKVLIKDDRHDEAGEYISYFSRMMQFLLEGTRQELVPLAKGLVMLKSHLHLMKLRQPGIIDYEIIIDNSIDPDQTLVPPLLEEVILPGYKEENEKRHIKITFTGRERKILISVEVRGSMEGSRGLFGREIDALKIINTRMEEMGKKYKVQLSFNFSELVGNDNKIEGMKVEFEIPFISEI